MITWKGNTANIKLDKKYTGKNLAYAVKEALTTEGYKAHIESEELLTLKNAYNHKKRDEFKDITDVIGHKHKSEKTPMTFSGKLKALYVLPVLGWAMYILDKSVEKNSDTVVKAHLNNNTEYDSLDLIIGKDSHLTGCNEIHEDISGISLSIHPNVKKDLERFETDLYSILAKQK